MPGTNPKTSDYISGNNSIRYVRVDSSVLMGISNHERFSKNHQGWGQLLGLVNEDYIELTSSYPLLEVQEDSYEEEMRSYEKTITCVNQNFNIDNNKVGWYYISNANDYLSSDVFYSNLNYASNKMYSIFMVYDCVEARSGSPCPFKVYFLSDAWLKAAKLEEAEIDANSVKKFNLKFDKMYTEIPIEVVTNPLSKIFLTQHEKDINNTLNQISKIDTNTNLTSNVKNVGTCMDDLHN